jgi:hypothetical protein
MDGNTQPQPQRIQQNPHLAECLDFSDGSFDDLIAPLVEPGRTREQVVENFRTAWLAQNDRRKALWDAQVLADRSLKNTCNAQQPEQGESAQANDNGDASRRKPKLGAFAQNTSIGNEITLKPSTFAINRLRNMEYVELYCFTPAGCRDHANQRTTMTDEAFGFSYSITPDGSTGNMLTLKPLALVHPGKIVPDENLTWEQVHDAKARYLNHVVEAGWDWEHVNALALFFVNLGIHPFIHSAEGKQALAWYQAHVREDWHRKLGTPGSFNLSILNDTLLAAFKKKADYASVQSNVAMVSQSPLWALQHTDPCLPSLPFNLNPSNPHRTYTYHARHHCLRLMHRHAHNGAPAPAMC